MKKTEKVKYMSDEDAAELEEMVHEVLEDAKENRLKQKLKLDLEKAVKK